MNEDIQIVIVGTLDIHEDDAVAAAELMRVMMTESAKEEGCHLYAFAQDLTQANRFQLSELWENSAVLERHNATSHMTDFRTGLANLRVLNRSVKRYAVSAIRPI